MRTNNHHLLEDLKGEFLSISILKEKLQFLFFKKVLTEKNILAICIKEQITHLYHEKEWYVYMPSFISYLSLTIESSSPILTRNQNLLPEANKPKAKGSWCFYPGRRRLESILKNKTQKSFLYYQNYFEFDIKPYRAIGLFLTCLNYESNNISIETFYKVRVWLANYISSKLPKDFENIESISQSSEAYKNLTQKFKSLFLSDIPLDEDFVDISDTSLELILSSLKQYSSVK